MSQVNRRRLLFATGALSALAGFDVLSQSGTKARVGFLTAQPPLDPPAGSFRYSNALHNLGWVEGRNLVFEPRFAVGKLERLTTLAESLVRSQVQVVIAQTTAEVKAIRQVNASIPVVVTAALDPVTQGLTANLLRPTSNITGVFWAEPTFINKVVEISKELRPDLRAIGFIYTVDIGIEPYVEALAIGTRALGVVLHRFPVSRLEHIGPALADVKSKSIDFLYVGGAGVTGRSLKDSLNSNNRRKFPPPMWMSGDQRLGAYSHTFLASRSEFFERRH